MIAYMILTCSLDYIYPLLGSLEDLHEYDVESQIQYYAPLNVQMEFKEDGAIIAEDQLKAFVNSAEWNLGKRLACL